MTTDVNTYLAEGCGRCALGSTPDCKVHSWTNELKLLRQVVLDCGLTEESKWGVPCYTYLGHNLAVVSAFKNYACLSFFKGVLLQDSHKILDKPGENTQSARIIKITSTKQAQALAPILKAYIFEAIEVEKAGLKVSFEKAPDPIPEELTIKFKEEPNLKAAFEALTPGRQRGYILHFSQPKQAKTRVSRIEKCIPKIMEGKGFHDR
ncbi:YdeI/OmpD-associated family protein [Roseivirga pacifica]|uniref:YdeI/OmpD-associated family protein n=1 Tax=Roseivirga pacifica TaxID=1267423 RepID=UPI00227B360E|nr:YdeI/OmpD-associated family protein [Roseivirga pacifica]